VQFKFQLSHSSASVSGATTTYTLQFKFKHIMLESRELCFIGEQLPPEPDQPHDAQRTGAAGHAHMARAQLSRAWWKRMPASGVLADQGRRTGVRCAVFGREAPPCMLCKTGSGALGTAWAGVGSAGRRGAGSSGVAGCMRVAPGFKVKIICSSDRCPGTICHTYRQNYTITE
jgi:hypothetical protein